MIQALDLSAPLQGGVRDSSGTRLYRFRVVDVLRLAIAFMVVAQLGRIPVLAAGGKDAPLLINDLLIGVIVLTGGLAALRRRRLVLDLPAAFALGFAAVGATSALLAIPRFGLSPAEFTFSIAYLLRWLAYFGVYLVTINFLRAADVPRVWRTLESAVVCFSLFGIFQSIFLPNFAQVVYPDSVLYMDWDPQGHRLVSTFLDPNFAGALIAMALLVSIARMAYGLEVSRWRLFVLLVALALTVSRGAVLGFGAGMLLILHARGLSKGLLRFVAVGSVFVLPALPLALRYALTHNKFTFDASAMTRVFGWLTGLEVFSRHPIIGVGFNTYGFVQAKLFGGGLFRASFGLDGGLLFVAVLTGVVGLAMYLGMIAAVFIRCRRIWRDPSRPAEARGFALGVGALTTAIVVHSFFLNTLFYPFLMEPLWVFWGLSLVIWQAEGQGAAYEPPQRPVPALRLAAISPSS